MAAPVWPHYRTVAPNGDAAYLASVGGGPVFKIDRAGGGTTGDRFAYPEISEGYRGGLSGAWGPDGNLYVLPGKDGGPHLRGFDRFGSLIRNAMVGDPNHRGGYVPVVVGVPVPQQVPVVVPLPPVVVGDAARPDVLRVFLDWQSRRYPAAADVRAAAESARQTLGAAAGRFAFVAGPLPSDRWGGYCWITVATGLAWVDGGITPDDVTAPTWKPWDRRGSVIEDDHSLSAPAVGKMVAHELAHCVGAPADHSWNADRPDLVAAGAVRAIAAAAHWR